MGVPGLRFRLRFSVYRLGFRVYGLQLGLGFGSMACFGFGSGFGVLGVGAEV